MKVLNATDGFILHAWMVTELGLGGCELMTYALVHQFSQSQAGCYKGGVPYLAAWLQCTPNTARRYLQNLEAKGLIRAKRGTNNGVPYCYYELGEGTPQKLQGTPQKLQGTPQKLRVDNTIDNTKKVIPPFIPPKTTEVTDYALRRGFIDPEGFAAHFIAYYSHGDHPWHLSNGKPMKDWKRAVITWEPNNKYRYFDNRQASARQATHDAFISSLI